MKYRTQLIDLVVFFNCSDFGEATELRLGGNFLSQVSYSGVETKDTNSQFKILKLGRRFGSAPPTWVGFYCLLIRLPLSCRFEWMSYSADGLVLPAYAELELLVLH